jgi:exodeoxyribonuclease V alpha subunit
MATESISGYVERITYQNPDNGYTVAQLRERGRKDLTCIVGTMPLLKPGETIRCIGSWKQHLVHGRQFTVNECHIEAPADLIGIRKYLGSGLIKGIGPTYAKRIVEKFGVDTLNIIDRSPEKLNEVEGLGEKRVEKIIECWQGQKSIREVMIFLQSHGVSPTYAQKIFKIYGQQSIQRVKENPYYLARDIKGIGFKMADVIAAKLGIDKKAPQRIDTGIEYLLNELSSDGHVCYPLTELMAESATVLEVEKALVEASISNLKKTQRLEVFDLFIQGKAVPFVWIKKLFVAEVGIARELQRLKKATSHLRAIDLTKALEWVQSQLKITLAPTQQLAVTHALTDKVHIITGGPGTGKSTITNAILSISSKLTSKILLAAPTGRAAKRMSEITGKQAATLHSLLEYDFSKSGGFKRNRENPLDCDLIIVDESSMIDTYLMYSLLKAIPNHARLILVGDINQLPSVGPGNVLKDIISSNHIPVTTLTEIFRQAAGSHIVTNAHRINQGMFPNIENSSTSDFFFIEAQEPEQVLEQIISLVSQRLPRKYGLDCINDIQVLAPMKRGVIGTENLNVVLQETLNPSKNALTISGKKFAVGDKVMQIRNNYQKNVFNGDIGRISHINVEDEEVVVKMDDREVIYNFTDLDELVLSYAVSVHKYQGSECPCVVLPVHTSHFLLLTRNLLYTGVTRGKRLVILVGTKKALAITVKNDKVKTRYTGLQQAILGTSHEQGI